MVSSVFPMFMKLEGRRCLVVGAGKVGEPKIGGLIDTGARIHVVALEATEAVHAWARAGKVTLEIRPFTKSDLEGAFLAVVATASRSLNESIYREAQRRRVLCNVVDDPEYCDFYYPAVVRRGDLQLAISTNGHSPALAQRIRRELEIQFGPEYGEWLDELGRTRQQLFASKIDPEQRRRLLHELASREAFKKAQAAESNIEANTMERIS